MANIIVTLNGRPNSKAATYDEEGNELTPFIPADTGQLKITANGFEKILNMGECVGLDTSLVYTVEVI